MKKSVTGLTNMESSRRSGYGSGSWEHDTAIKAGLRIAIIPFQLSFFLAHSFPLYSITSKVFPARQALSCAATCRNSVIVMRLRFTLI